MLGWINDCVEKLVIKQFGVDAWHIIKQKAGCEVGDGAFYKLDHYSDQSTVDLVQAASEVSGLTCDQIYEAFGEFFVHYIRDEGYDNLLCCQGSTLRDWMNNINAIHTHLQSTFPKKMIMPQFWVEDGKDGALLLHYHSRRGNFLAPLAKGLVVEIAQFQFGLDIDMTMTEKQGVDAAKFTSWNVTTKNPADMYKLFEKKGGRNGIQNAPTTFKCPFTGMTGRRPSGSCMAELIKASEGPPAHLSDDSLGGPLSDLDDDSDSDDHDGVDDHSSNRQKHEEDFNKTTNANGSPSDANKRKSITTMGTVSSSTTSTSFIDESGIGMSPALTKTIFPYHICIDQHFSIVQIGEAFSSVLQRNESDILGQQISDLFEVTKPINMEWNWNWLALMQDQPFDVAPIMDCKDCEHLRFKITTVSMADGTSSRMSSHHMLIMTPDANNLNELRDMNLTMSDLPVHGQHRDAVFLREHLSTQMNNALKMEKLSRSLETEKILLEQLLPAHAAEGLRTGQTVEPRLHNNVTLFFSDIQGFTKICDSIYPWEVVGLLNRLYLIMDYLCERFNLYKIETIGDAYVCCSGLPEKDADHAKNVANFALAVQHCCQKVLSPVDGKSPIKLRIGVHSGPAASGVVGKTNPRYCVFGDTVNTCSRHESTGEPGRIHVSKQTKLALQIHGGFKLVKKGELTEMKGKGLLQTYWLHGSKALTERDYQQLDLEVSKLLETSEFAMARKCILDDSDSNNDLSSEMNASKSSHTDFDCLNEPFSKVSALPRKDFRQYLLRSKSS